MGPPRRTVRSECCVAVYLSEKGLVDLHALVRPLREHLSAAVPAVADGGVGVGHAAQEHRPLVVELLLRLSYTLVHRHHGVVQVCGTEEQSPDMTRIRPRGLGEVNPNPHGQIQPWRLAESETAIGMHAEAAV